MAVDGRQEHDPAHRILQREKRGGCHHGPGRTDDARQNPRIDAFEVALNSKVYPWSSEIEVVVYAEFPDEAARAAFTAHPIYAETTERVRPMRELRFSADFKAAV